MVATVRPCRAGSGSSPAWNSELAEGTAPARYTWADVHELSIAQSLVSLVQEQLPPEAGRVTAVDLRIGALAGVVRGALEFCYEMATMGTPLEGSVLRVTELPVVVHCSTCRADRALEASFVCRCPVCGELCGDIRQGRELDVTAIEYDAIQEVG